MSKLIRLIRGPYGRISTLILDHHLVEHAHADSHMQFWLEGSRKKTRVAGNLLPFDDENAVAINSWEPHASPIYAPGERCKFLLLYLKPNWLANLCARIGVSPKFSAASFPYTEEIRTLAVDLAAWLERHRVHCNLAVEAKLVELVEKSLLSVSMSEDQQMLTGAREVLDRRISSSIDLMSSNLDIRMSVGDIARSVGLSRPHFFALFKRQMKISPNIYWNTVRMETAIDLLAKSEMPLGDLSIEMGFSEPANFSRFFRMHSGVSPSAYRRKISPRIQTVGLTPVN